MADYTDNNNIKFDIRNDIGWQGIPGKFGNDANNWSRIESGRQTEIIPYVNAVEKDWNGAQIGES